MRRVVVTGLGAITPVGLNVSESWQNVLEGSSGIDVISSFDPSRLPSQIAGEVRGFSPESVLDAKEAKRSTRFIHLAMAAAKEALANSGLDTSIDLPQVGCSIGVGIGAIEVIRETSVTLYEKGPKRVSPFFIPYVITNMASGVVSEKFNLQGPTLCPATACTSGTHAIGEAWLQIKAGLADAMVCGGAEAAVSELAIAGFANMKALSRRNDNPSQASRPFDKDRDGFVLSEASGLLVIEEYEHAKRRGAHIYCEILGYGMSGDAFHITSPAPHGAGAQRCMRKALQQAKISHEKVSYINAHGTSTDANDRLETEAIKAVFGSHADRLSVSSTKGSTGHALGAAGGIEAIFLAKSIKDQVAPPTANLQNAGEGCDLDYIPGAARELPIEVGISNSFGFGGTNGSLVMSRV